VPGERIHLRRQRPTDRRSAQRRRHIASLRFAKVMSDE
jgi:hypothetical protein